MKIKRSISEQIFDDIVQKIRSREIRPGQRLIIKALENQYNVSSTPIRDAINQLVYYGFVALNGSMSSVVEMDLRQIKDIVDVNEELTAMSFHLLQLNGKLPELYEKMEPFYEVQLALKDADSSERVRAFADFCNIPGANTGNAYYLGMIEQLWGFSVVAFGDYTDVIDPDAALAASGEMMEALKRSDWEGFQRNRYFIINSMRSFLARKMKEA